MVLFSLKMVKEGHVLDIGITFFVIQLMNLFIISI